MPDWNGRMKLSNILRRRTRKDHLISHTSCGLISEWIAYAQIRGSTILCAASTPRNTLNPSFRNERSNGKGGQSSGSANALRARVALGPLLWRRHDPDRQFLQGFSCGGE